MPIDLYYVLASTPCRSVLLLAKNLGIEFNLKPFRTDQREQLKPEYLKINPQHCVPTIVDNGFALWESRAILCYLVNQYGKDDSLYPKDVKKRAIVNQRLYFDIGTLFAKEMDYLMGFRQEGGPTKESLTKLEEVLQLLDKFLDGQEWLAGSNITIADYSSVVNVALLELLEYDLSKYKNISNWLPRVKKAIKGYAEIQDAAAVEIKKYMAGAS